MARFQQLRRQAWIAEWIDELAAPLLPLAGLLRDAKKEINRLRNAPRK